MTVVSNASCEKQTSRPAGQPRFGVLKTALFSMIPVVTLLVAGEVLFRVVELCIPPVTQDVGHGFTRDTPHFAPDPAAPGMMRTNPARALWPAHQTRFALPKPPRHFRMFALGGSTARDLKDLEHLKALLQPRLAPGTVFEVINCGTDSFGSHRVRLIAEEIMAYEPDLLFVYSGHNECWDEEVEAVSDLEWLYVVKLCDRFAMSRFFRDRLVERHNATLRKRYGWTDGDSVPHVGPMEGWQGASPAEWMPFAQISGASPKSPVPTVLRSCWALSPTTASTPRTLSPI